MSTPADTTKRLPRQPAVPAWAISVTTHTVLLIVIVLALKQPVRQAGDEPDRNVGIVLKHVAASQETFESANTGTADTNLPDASSRDPLPAELPEAIVADALPTLPAIGAGLLEADGLPTATGLGSITSRGGQALAGGKATVRVFGTQGVGNRFVYLFDRSSSMSGGPLATAKQELLNSLDSLESTHQFQIIFFNHDLRIFDLTGGQQRVPFATDENKDRAAAWFKTVSADGGTDRLPAIKRALALRPDVIFFLTDADNPMTAYDLDAVRRSNRGGTAINTIEFAAGRSRDRKNFLTQLASESGGQYVHVDVRKFRN